MNSRQNLEIAVAQLNMNGQLAVPVQLIDYCRSGDIEVLLLQEPPIESGRLYGFDFEGARVVMGNGKGKAEAAIVVLNQEIEVMAIWGLTDRFCAVATVRKKGGREITLVSAYFKYSVPVNIFTDRVRHILGGIGDRVVIGADVNAHSDRWHSRRGNNNGWARGTHVDRLVEDSELTVHNREGQPDTYDRQGMGSSNIDVTLTRGEEMVGAIRGWEVLEGITDSDHRLIRYRVRTGRGVAPTGTDRVRYNDRKADWDRFRESLNQGIWDNRGRLEGETEEAAGALVEVLQAAMKASMPRMGGLGRTKPPWWDRELECSKRGLLAFRRRCDWKGVDREEYRRLRNLHTRKVRTAKISSWREFATSINDNVWGPVYKWARKGSRESRLPAAVIDSSGALTKTTQETADCLLNTLIPTDQTPPALRGVRTDRVGVIGGEEVKRAIWRMAPRKAPGLDGITGVVLRRAWGTIGGVFTKILDRCIRKSTFPDCWKTADIVIIKKGADRDPSLPKSYRPVSLLPTVSKVLERLIVVRLEDETGATMSRDQHGFTIGRSTVSAIRDCLGWTDGRKEKLVVGIFLDISGAFDNLDWVKLIEDMEEVGATGATRSIIESYLTGRQASLTVGQSTSRVRLTRGCPQGSQLGPVLWKMSMDRALKIDRDDRTKVVAYADDIAVLVAGTNLEVIRRRAYGLLESLRGWASERGLSFSASKTQVMSLKGGLKPGFMLGFGDENVISVSPIRYLGVLVDYKRNYWEHIREVAGKSEALYSRLRGATSANWGLGQRGAEIIYKAVFLPRITYASEIWSRAVKTAKAVKLLGSAQRRPLLAITRAYRTTSTDALQVIAGKLPLDLEVEWGVLGKRAKTGEITTDERDILRERILDVWQDRWDRSDKGRWTYGILPNVRFRLGICPDLDHYAVQFLSGHGDFNSKLKYLGLAACARCRCLEAEETVAHVLFGCKLLDDARGDLKKRLCPGGEAWPCDVQQLVATRSNYQGLAKFARVAIDRKRDYTYRNSLRRRAMD